MRLDLKDRGADTGAAHHNDPVVRKLSALADLEPADIDLLASLKGADHYGAGRTMRPVDGRSRQRFVVSGWVARQKLMSDGRRQILSVVLPGDLITLGDPELAWNSVSLSALTPVETVDAAPVFAPGRMSPGLAAALTAAEALEQWLQIEQIVRLGRRAALERSAHFLLETEFRLNLAGLCDRGRFALPLTQEVLSDVLGLSIVHVNRTLLQLRRERWIELRSRVVELLRKDQLVATADFQPPPLVPAEPRASVPTEPLRAVVAY